MGGLAEVGAAGLAGAGGSVFFFVAIAGLRIASGDDGLRNGYFFFSSGE